MNYVLNNQKYIVSAYSEDYLNRHIIPSLEEAFANTPIEIVTEAVSIAQIPLEMYFRIINRENYQAILINDIADNNAMLEFAIIGKRFGALKLAFMGRIKG